MMRLIPTAFLLGLALLAAPLLAEPPAEPTPAPAAAQDPTAANVVTNKALVSRYIKDVLSAGHLELLDQLLAPDFIDSTPGAPQDVKGPEVIRRSQARAHQLFPEIVYTIEDLIAEGDKVVARYTVRARTQNTDTPGKSVEVTGITVFRIADGRIREAWIINDQIELFQQLGYTLQPPQS
jgi:steroid delta-isomerase-like uncharacterized protein